MTRIQDVYEGKFCAKHRSNLRQNGNCVECSKEYHTEYMKGYRENNREELNFKRQQWRNKNRETYLAAAREYRKSRKPSRYVYAIRYNKCGLLKTGSSTNRITDILSTAKKYLIQYQPKVEFSDAEVIWRTEGDEIFESFLQVCLSEYLLPAFANGKRHSEWCRVPQCASTDDICEYLDKLVEYFLDWKKQIPEPKFFGTSNGSHRSPQ